MPSIDSLKNRQSKSSQYILEKQELPFVTEELKRRRNAKINFDAQFKNLIGLVPEKGNLVLFPEILYDSSKRSGAEIVEFAPISEEDINSCSSKVGINLFNDNFQNDFSSDGFGDDQEFEYPEDNFPIDDFQLEANNSKLEIYQFNLDEREVTKEFESLTENISDIFESNYFVINIKSDYLNSLKFLRYLQEYKLAILPYCFEPQMIGNISSNLGTENISSVGEINARIIVNIPNHK